jgi:dehydrogenase/reductase SDR family member 7B
MSSSQTNQSIGQYFQDKVIWITGASSGIGLALVEALQQQENFIIISARNKVALESIQARFGVDRIGVVELDLASKESVDAAITRALALKGRVDILFNNGGISQRSMATETNASVLRQIMEVNFFANTALAQAVLPGMMARNYGHIVVTSSLMGKWGFYLRSAYGASKHALHGYYDSLRMEVETNGVSITLLTPGFIATEISKHALVGDGSLSGDMDNNQAKGLPAAECARRILMGVAKGTYELPVGGKEIRGIWVKRIFPRLFERILRRQSSR